jgi:hypothetical protein
MFPKKTIPMLFLAIEGDRREVSPYSSRIHRNRSALLIAVQPSFSTVYCKTLNIFIKVCYSLPCTPAQSPDSDPVQEAPAPEQRSPVARSFHLPH